MRRIHPPAGVSVYTLTDRRVKRFRKLRRLQAWGAWARGWTLVRIGREIGGQDGRPITRDRARQLVAGGRRFVRQRLGTEFVERIDRAHAERRREEQDRQDRALVQELER